MSKRVGQLELYENGWNWRINCWDRQAQFSGYMVRTQANLLLKAMSEFMARQWQESVLISMVHITIGKKGAISGQGIHQGPPECPGSVHD